VFGIVEQSKEVQLSFENFRSLGAAECWEVFSNAENYGVVKGGIGECTRLWWREVKGWKA